MERFYSVVESLYSVAESLYSVVESLFSVVKGPAKLLLQKKLNHLIHVEVPYIREKVCIFY